MARSSAHSGRQKPLPSSVITICWRDRRRETLTSRRPVSRFWPNGWDAVEGTLQFLRDCSQKPERAGAHHFPAEMNQAHEREHVSAFCDWSESGSDGRSFHTRKVGENLEERKWGRSWRKSVGVLVREAGLEPAHFLQYRILSPGRLPIPPLPQ